MPSVVIIGAGISGLSLAYRLRQQSPDASITVLEAAQRIGGKVWTEKRDDFLIESGANGFLDLKPSGLELCHDLGIGNQLISGSECIETIVIFFGVTGSKSCRIPCSPSCSARS